MAYTLCRIVPANFLNISYKTKFDAKKSEEHRMLEMIVNSILSYHAEC